MPSMVATTCERRPDESAAVAALRPQFKTQLHSTVQLKFHFVRGPERFLPSSLP